MARGCPVLLLVCALGCPSANRTVLVRVRDADGVKVDAPDGARVERSKDDVKVDGDSVFSREAPGDAADGIVTRAVLEAPDALALEDGRYVWRRGAVTASTPRDNLLDATLITEWDQPGGEVLSVVAIVLGGVCALGFGVAGVSLLAEGGAPDTPTFQEGLGLTIASGVSLGVVGWGIGTFALQQGSPYRDPLPIEGGSGSAAR